MHIDIFPTRLYKYYLDPTELKEHMLKRYDSFKEHSTNGTPSEWTCNLRTEFHGAFPHKYREAYADIMHEWKDEMGFYGRPSIDEIWLNAYEKENFQEPHSHLPGFYSGIHYICFDPEEHTGTTFQNPMEQLYTFMFNPDSLDIEKNEHVLEGFDIDVEEGDIILFPSHLRHYVRRNTSKHLRMTISFNINRVDEDTRRVFA
jgi:hypothetical protein